MLEVPMIDLTKIEPRLGWQMQSNGDVLVRGQCGHVCELEIRPTAYSVAKDGSVSPSVQCPKDGCAFHETIRLLGWK